MKVCKKVDCIHYSNNLKCGLHRDEYADAKFIFRDNIDQLLAALKGESDD